MSDLRDNDFDEWWMKEPVGEFSGVDAGHVERAFAAGRKVERLARRLNQRTGTAIARVVESGDFSAKVEWLLNPLPPETCFMSPNG